MISRIIRWYNEKVGSKIENGSVWIHENGEDKVVVRMSMGGMVFYKTTNFKNNFELRMDACKFKSIFKKITEAKGDTHEQA